MTLEKNNQIPDIIEGSIAMSEANTPIVIYEGDYYLKSKGEEIKVKGKINFDWFPSFGSCFSGKVISETSPNYLLSNLDKEYKVFVEDLQYGSGFIINTNTSFGSNLEGTDIKGKVYNEAVDGDKTISVEKIAFSIPNFRSFLGSSVKKVSDNNRRKSMNRLKLENDDYIIFIDKCLDYDAKLKSLNENGGYIILYYGELKRKKGPVKIEDTKDIFYCLNTFITFLNGRRTAAVFLQGIYKQDVIWTDYSRKNIDTYKNIQSWTPKFTTEGFDVLWKKFSELWKDTNDKHFLTTVIHWYIEANNNRGFTDGSIVMAQSALELLYNWWIIEGKKMIVGKDSERLNAANKIRLLLSQLNITHFAPEEFTDLKEFIENEKEIKDAPDAIVQIRNAVVHSQEQKRRKLRNISIETKYEALQLSIWYIEMALLRILNYKFKYINRCSDSNHEEHVPWK